jgi:Ca2+-binding EF-hand superfamily protein
MLESYVKERAEEKPMSPGTIKLLFNSVDANGNGLIDEDELALLLDTLGVESAAQKAQEMLEKIDDNHDGVITFNELSRFISNGKH